MAPGRRSSASGSGSKATPVKRGPPKERANPTPIPKPKATRKTKAAAKKDQSDDNTQSDPPPNQSDPPPEQQQQLSFDQLQAQIPRTPDGQAYALSWVKVPADVEDAWTQLCFKAAAAKADPSLIPAAGSPDWQLWVVAGLLRSDGVIEDGEEERLANVSKTAAAQSKPVHDGKSPAKGPSSPGGQLGPDSDSSLSDVETPHDEVGAPARDKGKGKMNEEDDSDSDQLESDNDEYAKQPTPSKTITRKGPATVPRNKDESEQAFVERVVQQYSSLGQTVPAGTQQTLLDWGVPLTVKGLVKPDFVFNNALPKPGTPADRFTIEDLNIPQATDPEEKLADFLEQVKQFYKKKVDIDAASDYGKILRYYGVMDAKGARMGKRVLPAKIQNPFGGAPRAQSNPKKDKIKNEIDPRLEKLKDKLPNQFEVIEGAIFLKDPTDLTVDVEDLLERAKGKADGERNHILKIAAKVRADQKRLAQAGHNLALVLAQAETLGRPVVGVASAQSYVQTMPVYTTVEQIQAGSINASLHVKHSTTDSKGIQKRATPDLDMHNLTLLGRSMYLMRLPTHQRKLRGRINDFLSARQHTAAQQLVNLAAAHHAALISGARPEEADEQVAEQVAELGSGADMQLIKAGPITLERAREVVVPTVKNTVANLAPPQDNKFVTLANHQLQTTSTLEAMDIFEVFGQIASSAAAGRIQGELYNAVFRFDQTEDGKLYAAITTQTRNPGETTKRSTKKERTSEQQDDLDRLSRLVPQTGVEGLFAMLESAPDPTPYTSSKMLRAALHPGRSWHALLTTRK